jgi:glycosyltransferase involved in cell wall biosynthesis
MCSKPLAQVCGRDLPALDNFDPQWYLQTYPDVASAGVDPLEHYINYGRFEGRRPFQNRALVWEYHLWRGGNKFILPQLEQLSAMPNAISQERYYAAWAIARWYAANGDWSKVFTSLSLFQCADYPYPSHAGPFLLIFEAALQHKQWSTAQEVLLVLAQRFTGQVDVILAEVNLLVHKKTIKATKDPNGQLNHLILKTINQVFIQNELCGLAADNDKSLNLDSLHPAEQLPIVGGEGAPRVSVIIPTYNAERTLETALRSLCEQSWRNLEILVVDDASKDATWEVLEKYVRNTHLRPGVEIRLLRHEKNQGTYAARNTALKVASGDLITTHDSDDWSHPQKIEYQVKALMLESSKVGCTSHWVRTTNELHFSHWRPEDSWVYRNVSSLMFRRSVFEMLGYWDRVTVNGDTEYYYRILNFFGEDSLTEVLLGVPLSFGRINKNSLSRCSETNLFTRFYGIRKDYEDAAKRWHTRAKSAKDLYLPANPRLRYFKAPAAICHDKKIVQSPNPMDIVQQSGYFDAAWYLEQNSDLQEAPIDLFEHYWLVGSLEGRDPGPEFSTTGYGYRFPEARVDKLPTLYHYLTVGLAQGFKPLAEIPGTQPHWPGALNLLVCTHQAGNCLFGAERSLLDVLAALNKLEVNLIVVLPSAINTAYVEAIKSMAKAVMVLPYGWWKADRKPCPQTLMKFKQLIDRFDIQAVYANTLVLDEPLLAARALEVLTVIHVRELPSHDEALCKTLGATAKSIIARVGKLADITLVNSKAVEKEISVEDVIVLPNMIDIRMFSPPLEAIKSKESPVRIALISSNLPKKGLVDFVKLAEILEQRSVPVVCKLIGPENEYTRDLRERQQSGEISQCLQFTGYIASSQEALAQVDIVVNLSHFKESFGRTILEAMAAACPVVAYDWGALSELIVDGENGYLVPLGEVETIADRVMLLVEDPVLRLYMGMAGRRRAEENYSFEAMVTRFGMILHKIEHLCSRSAHAT